MITEGQHLIMDVWFQPSNIELYADVICDYIRRKFTVVNKVEHKFSPHGRTIVLVLSESHFTVHTYPENNYLSMDLYICNMGVDLDKVGDEILEPFPVSHARIKVAKRG